jgi:hypothetical protein
LDQNVGGNQPQEELFLLKGDISSLESGAGRKQLPDSWSDELKVAIMCTFVHYLGHWGLCDISPSL